MSETAVKTPWRLWVLGVVALLWNAYGCYDIYMFKTGAYDYQMRAKQVAFFHSVPAWAWGVWATSVGAALLGAILLLLRSRWAFHAFVVSFAAGVLNTIYFFGLSEGGEVMGRDIGMIFAAVAGVVGIFYVWYAHSAAKRGILR